MAEAKNQIRSDDVRATRLDMKLEVVVIPVSDVSRAKEFYASLGWRLDADFAAGDDFRVIQFTPPGSGCSIIFGKNVTAAAPGSAQGLYLIVSDVAAARAEFSLAVLRSAKFSTMSAAYTPARTNPICLGASGLVVETQSIAATARSPRSMIPTATVGCSRRSQRECPVALTPRRRTSRR